MQAGPKWQFCFARCTTTSLVSARFNVARSFATSVAGRRWVHLQRRTNSSFIKTVMEQVQKELETNEELRKSMKEFQESGFADKSNRAAQALSNHFQAAQQSLTAASVKAAKSAAQTREALDRLATSSQLGRFLSAGLTILLKSAVDGSRIAVATLNGLFKLFEDDRSERTLDRLQKWRQTQTQRADAPAESVADDISETNATPIVVTDALTLAQSSAWDRFGTKLRDMPVLQNFFESPLLGKIFGETAQAAAVREMKTIDSTFKLRDLCELAEFVIAPQLLRWFLLGDEDMLKRHCGEAAFAAASKSLREREAMKLFLDPTVLWLRDVEFRGEFVMLSFQAHFIYLTLLLCLFLRSPHSKLIACVMQHRKWYWVHPMTYAK